MHLFQSLPFLEFVEDKSLWVNISQNTLWWCPILVVAKFERLSHHCFKSKSSIFGGLDITLQTSLKSIDIPKLKALDQTRFPNFVNLCSELLQIKKKMKLKDGFNNKNIARIANAVQVTLWLSVNHLNRCFCSQCSHCSHCSQCLLVSTSVY